MCHIYCTDSLWYAFIPLTSLNYTGNADKFIDEIKDKQTDQLKSLWNWNWFGIFPTIKFIVKKNKNCFKSCISLSIFLCLSCLLSGTKSFAIVMKECLHCVFCKLGTLSLKISLYKTALINCWDVKYDWGYFLS